MKALRCGYTTGACAGLCSIRRYRRRRLSGLSCRHISCLLYLISRSLSKRSTLGCYIIIKRDLTVKTACRLTCTVL